MSGISLHEVGGDLVIDVPEEQTLIGRGQFLQVTDKRVSRSHAILDVIDRKLYITPNHSNPCFLRLQGSEVSSILQKDVKQVLHHGDAFGLLPEQFYYKVDYPQVNGKDRESEKSEDTSNDVKEDKKELPAVDKDADATPNKENGTASDKDWDKAADDFPATKVEPKNAAEAESDEDDKAPEKKTVKTKIGNVALPLNKKRPLPAWMVRISAGSSSTKPKPAAKKPTSTAVNKQAPGQKLTYAKDDDDDDDDYEEEAPLARGRGRQLDEDDDDFDENISDDDYVPEKTKKRSQAKKRKTYSESDDDDFSDDDDDDDDEDYYAPKKKKPKAPSKKTPKGKGKKGGRGRQSVSPRKTPARNRKRNRSDDDNEDVSLPRRGAYDDDDDDDEVRRRPQRAARAKRGSYVDDPMIEEALEDFPSDDDEADVNEAKDSDFDLEAVDDSGSDWEKKKKLKAQKPVRAKVPPRGPTKKTKKKAPRKTRSYSDDEDDVLEDDEPYVPRPSKRRGGGAVSQKSDESGDEKRRRRREPCQYGEKCYRKNPVHFRTYCHPGDSSYDEDDEKPTSKDGSKRDRDSSKVAAEKPSRPQRSTAGTRLVTQGSVVDDDLPDTYDYNDSFIDDGTQYSDDAEDSDYDAEEDVRGLTREAKKLIKNKKITQKAFD